MQLRSATLTILFIVISVAGCSAASGPSPAAMVSVSGAWARPSTGVENAGAAYFTITNGTGAADKLVSVTSPASAHAELHETTADASGMMAMRPVDGIDVPAGGTVDLKPGSYHVMLIDLVAELVAGSSVELTLQFEQAGAMTITAEVRGS